MALSSLFILFVSLPTPRVNFTLVSLNECVFPFNHVLHVVCLKLGLLNLTEFLCGVQFLLSNARGTTTGISADREKLSYVERLDHVFRLIKLTDI